MITCAAAALAMMAAQPASDPLGPASIIIAHSLAVAYSDPVAGTNDFRYVARLEVAQQLAGPRLGEQEIISFVSSAIPVGALALTVRKDGLGRLWARRHWQSCAN